MKHKVADAYKCFKKAEYEQNSEYDEDILNSKQEWSYVRLPKVEIAGNMWKYVWKMTIDVRQ